MTKEELLKEAWNTRKKAIAKIYANHVKAAAPANKARADAVSAANEAYLEAEAKIEAEEE